MSEQFEKELARIEGISNKIQDDPNFGGFNADREIGFCEIYKDALYNSWLSNGSITQDEYDTLNEMTDDLVTRLKQKGEEANNEMERTRFTEETKDRIESLLYEYEKLERKDVDGTKTEQNQSRLINKLIKLPLSELTTFLEEVESTLTKSCLEQKELSTEIENTESTLEDNRDRLNDLTGNEVTDADSESERSRLRSENTKLQVKLPTLRNRLRRNKDYGFYLENRNSILSSAIISKNQKEKADALARVSKKAREKELDREARETLEKSGTLLGEVVYQKVHWSDLASPFKTAIQSPMVLLPNGWTDFKLSTSECLRGQGKGIVKNLEITYDKEYVTEWLKKKVIEPLKDLPLDVIHSLIDDAHGKSE